MPIHIPSVNRRGFLQIAGVAGAASLLGGVPLRGKESSNSSWALIADTHVAADPEAMARGVKMRENLALVWSQIRKALPTAAGTLLHGDCAYLTGEAGDYATLAKTLLPEGKADLPLHFLLGNHDHRDRFREGLAEHSKDSPLVSNHVARIDAGVANWFLLDSLDKVNVTPGRLGAEQVAWLGRMLDEHADKPALISVHHQPQLPPTELTSGLTDTQALLDVIVPRKQVKAVFFGHTHVWKIASHEGIHLVNLPPVAYVFQAGLPNGWVEAQLAAESIKLVLHTLDEQHPLQGKTQTLAWR